MQTHSWRIWENAQKWFIILTRAISACPCLILPSIPMCEFFPPQQAIFPYQRDVLLQLNSDTLYLEVASDPGGTSGKELACQYKQHKRLRFSPWVGKIPWRKALQPTPVFLPGEPNGQSSLAGYSPRGSEELDMIAQHTHSIRSHELGAQSHQRAPCSPIANTDARHNGRLSPVLLTD